MQSRSERMKAVEDKIASVKALVKQKYNIDLSDLVVRYDLKGRVAGWAIGFRTIRLNTSAIYGDEAHFRAMLDDTIPHEIAHIVCHRNPSLGRKHDYGWASVCRALGGTGKRTHDMTTIEFARGRTYIYTTTTGREYGVSERRHRLIQMGSDAHFRKAGWGKIDRNCAYVVKLNGRVISTHPAKDRPGILTTMLNTLTGRSETYPLPAGTRVAVAAEKPVAAVTTRPVTSTGTSFAEQVRGLIRAAKAAGYNQEYVYQRAVTTLGMKPTSARNCVKHNWDRV